MISQADVRPIKTLTAETPETMGIVKISELLQRRKVCIEFTNAYKRTVELIDKETQILNDEIKDIESSLLNYLERNGIDQVKTPFGNPTLILGRHSVDVFDVGVLPEQFKTGSATLPFNKIPDDMIDKFEITPLKNLIAAALKDGEVPGAKLVQGKPYLKIL